MKKAVFTILSIAVLLAVPLAALAGSGAGSYYANSPAGIWSTGTGTNLVSHDTGTALRKFVDALPTFCPTKNGLGQCIPLATANTTSYPGSDYYEIAVQDYTEKMHTDLPKATKLRGYRQVNTADPNASVNHYLGPIIVATQNRPVRLKFINSVGTGTAGNLFIPVDTTQGGAGTGPGGQTYTQNRATLHLHGGFTPWISDGTPHQWTAPALETSTTLTRGLSTVDVPDMPGAGAGNMTFYWTNQQSGRLMFYHDHVMGITRLNVYAGEAAGYLIRDTQEQGWEASGILPPFPSNNVPLIIQDKTFVPKDVLGANGQDTLWTNASWGTYGDLWYTHVYEPNQTAAGINAKGRWDYGPYVFPPVTLAPANSTLPVVSGTPESFMDTPVVNGTAYPSLTVARQAYRFRILNAANDRMWNLQLYLASTATGTLCSGPTGTLIAANLCTEVRSVVANGATYSTPYGQAVTVPADLRPGGVADPTTAGPAIIQLANEGGILPTPVTFNSPPVPITWLPTGQVDQKDLLLAPAQRADVIIDFSQLASGTKLILYSDAPAPLPGGDPRYDYFTGDPDNTAIGGAPTTLAGYGPNTRTIMQIVVSGATASAPFNVAALTTAMTATTGFAASQPPLIVPAGVYGSVAMKEGDVFNGSPVHMKSINGLFDNFGRLQARLGTEPVLGAPNVLGFMDPATEVAPAGQTQIWNIVNNDMDTHPVHFHLVNVQVVNRVRWDGTVVPPDPNEAGWLETVRMNPGENTIVAIKFTAPTLPFAVPNSVRPLDPTVASTGPLGSVFDMLLNPNPVMNFGNEYVWHCHILGHEENDMMRPIVFKHSAIGVYTPSGACYVDADADGAYSASSNDMTFTAPTVSTDVMVSGDWTGDGIDKIGAYKGNGTWWLDLNNNHVVDAGETFSFGGGIAGAVPVVGDWTGSGTTKIGLFANGTWYLDLNGDHIWNGTPTDGLYNFGQGLAGVTPVVGDWSGNGKTKLGVYAGGIWYLDKNGDGTWNGTPTDAMFTFGAGLAGAVPVVGDWSGTGTSKLGVFVNGTWYLDRSGDGVWNGTPSDIQAVFGAGLAGAKPFVANW